MTGFSGRVLAALVMAAGFVWPVTVFAERVMVSHGYARATPPGASGAAAYLVLNNRAAQSVTLVGVTSGAAKQVMIHQNQLQGDMMRMRHVSQLEIAAGSQFRFEPGGHHLMLMGLVKPLRAGEELQLNLQFQHGDVLEISLPVLAVDTVVEMENHHE